MPNFAPLINGIRHSWSSITVEVYGTVLIGITAINYRDRQNIVNEHGAGTMPVDRKIGNYEAFCTMKIKRYEMDRITQNLPPGTRLQDLPPVSVTVAYVNKSDKMVVDIIHNLQWLDRKAESEQGSTTLEAELEAVISHVSWNVG